MGGAIETLRRDAELKFAALGAALACAALAVLIAGQSPQSLGTAETNGPALEAEVAGLPLSFEPAAGRGGPADFLAHSMVGGSVYLRSNEAAFALPSGGERTRPVGLRLRGADPGAIGRGLSELPGKANVYLGNDPSRWRAGLPTYARIRYESVYPGIDVDYYGNQRRLEYDFRVAPAADPSLISMDVRGADSVRLDRNGDLTIGAGSTTLHQRAPVAYQIVNGTRHGVEAGYRLRGSTISFELGRYDRSRPLVIDPLTFAYSTYLGGGGIEFGHGIAVDSAGAAYVTGQTDSAGGTPFPTQDAFQAMNGGGADVFVAKVNPDAGGATTLAYSTYLGGDATDRGLAIDVDSAGAAYLTGQTNSSGGTGFPVQDAAQATNGGGADAFVTKLDPDDGGTVSLAYSTYLGGGGFDIGDAIEVDSSGAGYVTGDTASEGGTPFPTEDALQTTNQGGDDAFVTKLNPDSGGAITLAYSTYLGGDATDVGQGIGVDSAGAAYVTGYTASAGGTPFPTEDAFQPIKSGDDDAFITKLDPDPGGTNDITLAYSTYLGGGGTDDGLEIDVDAAGAAYLTGATDSAGVTPFPTEGAFQATNQGGDDAFVTKLDPDPGDPGDVTLAYSTYLGGGAEDVALGLDADALGAVYVAGRTFSSGLTPFPTEDAFQATNQGGDDAFVTKLDPDPGDPGDVTLAYSTYLGGTADDRARAIATDAAGAAYLVGDTTGSGAGGIPTQDPFQADNGGGLFDGWVAKLPFTPIPPPGDDGSCAGTAATIVGTAAGEILRGTPGQDVVDGRAGKDRIRGLAGNDLICGGAGNDRVIAGGGRDRAIGGNGADRLLGGARRDILIGGAGRDRLNGGGGRDLCRGGPRRDRARSCEVSRGI